MIVASSWTNPIKQSLRVHVCDSSFKIAFLIGCKANANAQTSSKKAWDCKINETNVGRKSI